MVSLLSICHREKFALLVGHEVWMVKNDNNLLNVGYPEGILGQHLINYHCISLNCKIDNPSASAVQI
jgi:hypothetical protein